MKDIIKEALLEDGADNDITSLAIFGNSKTVKVGYLTAKEALVVSGLDVARDVFHTVSKKIRFITGYANGAFVKKGERIAKVEGNISDLLRAERVALNFLQHLSGVATLTHQFVEEVKPYRCRILDTRKTTPGLRLLEKKAVKDGGGENHRMNLSDQFLIKDNHIAACGGVREAIRKVQIPPHPPLQKGGRGGFFIEIEARNLREVREAMEEGADIILLDNMKLPQIRKAIQITKNLVGAYGPTPLLEVSGGVSLKNVRKIAQTGVARISIGALTHSAPAVDISFEIPNL